jgi:hypothetical protein
VVLIPCMDACVVHGLDGRILRIVAIKDQTLEECSARSP